MKNKKKPFSRSEFMREKHAQAKKQRSIFAQKFDKQDLPSYSSFLKRETPLENQIIAYEVSYQVSYRGQVDDITISPQTFLVYGFRNNESQIRENTMNMLIDSKGKITGHNLHPNTAKTIESNADIKIFPRGMEESFKQVPSDIKRQVINQNYVVKELDTTIKMKNKKGRTGDLNLDIRHFL